MQHPVRLKSLYRRSALMALQKDNLFGIRKSSEKLELDIVEAEKMMPDKFLLM